MARDHATLMLLIQAAAIPITSSAPRRPSAGAAGSSLPSGHGDDPAV
jgi:hypothetical protein